MRVGAVVRIIKSHRKDYLGQLAVVTYIRKQMAMLKAVAGYMVPIYAVPILSLYEINFDPITPTNFLSQAISDKTSTSTNTCSNCNAVNVIIADNVCFACYNIDPDEPTIVSDSDATDHRS